MGVVELLPTSFPHTTLTSCWFEGAADVRVGARVLRPNMESCVSCRRSWMDGLASWRNERRQRWRRRLAWKAQRGIGECACSYVQLDRRLILVVIDARRRRAGPPGGRGDRTQRWLRDSTDVFPPSQLDATRRGNCGRPKCVGDTSDAVCIADPTCME